MRRLRLIFSATVALGVLGLALGPGCRGATQVTLEITLANRASCAETNGTAITVGTDPSTTSKRVEDEFVTATTTSCDQATRQIGTLVLTPGESGRASVVVVVAYDKSIAPSSCKPPLFKGCIVARRQVTFAEYQQLHMPITIDPDCKDVPCDAFSTCRTGKCFSSETSCTGDTCTEPGDPGDGGTSADGEVDSPGPLGDGASEASLDGSSADGGADASDGATVSEGGTPDGVFCDIDGNLMCPTPLACNGGSSCCTLAGSAALSCAAGIEMCVAGSVQYCCLLAPCPFGTCRVAIAGAFPGGGGARGAAPLPGGATPAGTCQ